MGRSILIFCLLACGITYTSAAQMRLPQLTDTTLRLTTPRLLAQGFYTQHLSFFCRKELQIQKLTNLPIYFRLGSKNFVDYMEKKPNAPLPPQ